MFNFFKKKDRFITYEKPVVILNSKLAGFSKFVETDTQIPIPWMRIVEEKDSPYGRLYFEYIGNGKCKRAMKHDPVAHGKVESVLSLGLRCRIDDQTFCVNSVGTEYTRVEMFQVAFALCDEIMRR